MISQEAIPDRERLQRRAAARVRRGRRAGTAVALSLFGLVVLLAAVLSESGSWSGTEIAVVAVATVVGVGVLWLGFRWVGRSQHDPQLLLGAGRQDQRAVQRALRTGRATDARIDALTRDAAQRHLRRPWLMWVYAALAVLQFGLLTLRVADDDGWPQIMLSALVAVAWCLLSWQLVLARRRSRHYLLDVIPPIHTDNAALQAEHSHPAHKTPD